MNDETLLLQVKNIKYEAMKQVLKQRQRGIYNNSQSFLLKNRDLKALEQQGYIQLIKAIKNYKRNTNDFFTTFINFCIKRHTTSTIKNNNPTIKSNSYNDSTTSISSIYSIQDLFLSKELVRLLNNYLDKKLNNFEKQVLYYLIQQNTHYEIAKILGQSPKIVDNSIQKIKKIIMEYLTYYTNEEK